VLLAFGNQRNRPFNANLEALMASRQHQIFFGKKASGKLREGFGLLLLREEVGKEARKSISSTRDA
jgi:hypothetical protein